MRPRRAIVAALACTSLWSGAAAAEEVRLGDGGWSWFGDPRAVTFTGKHTRTYLGWLDRVGSVMVASYDHAARARAASVLHPALQRDDHANPSLQVRPDGRIVAYYSMHFGSQLLYRVSARPEDVRSWGPERSVPTNVAVPPGSPNYGYTYPSPVRLSGERATYLFWRGADYQPTFSVQKDGARGWARARTLLRAPGQRPYVKYDTNGRDRIDVAFTNAHPGESGDVNIYYARYRAGRIERADGKKLAGLGTPIVPADADKVFDGPENAWVHDVAEDARGRPLIVFASFPSPGDHRYNYARWTGSRWDVHQLTRAGGSISANGLEPLYSGGITLDHEDPSHVYLSRQVGAGWRVEAWATRDGGAHWVSRPISGSTVKNVRPVSPRGLVPLSSALRVIWMRGAYNSYWTYETSVAALWGTPKHARVRLSRATALVNRAGRARISIRCLAALDDRCVISGTVWHRRGRLGKLTGTLRGGRRGKASLRLTRRGLRRLRRTRRLEVRLVVVSRNLAGVPTTARSPARLRLPR